MTSGLLGLAVVIALAAALGILAHFLRQPSILAYIATGIVIAHFGFLHLTGGETFKVFSELGIMFLLFLVGLEINYTSLRLVGKASLMVGIGQIVFTTLGGFGISFLLGFSLISSFYIAIALTFSSTIIIVKLLSDKRDLNSLYGKISIGFLLVQDFVAILMLLALSGIQAGEGIKIIPLLITLGKGVVLFVVLLWLGRSVLKKLFDRFARSQELLFLTSLAWVLVLAAVVSKIGFSIEIAGFLAGLALANSSEHYQIASRIKPLRDFFIIIFFVILGSSLIFSDFSGLLVPIIALSLFVLIGNPLIVLAIMGIMGYRKRTSFMAGVTVAQISEFSLILAALGLKVGHITENVVALITAVGVVTITLSTYLIIHAERIFKRFGRWFSIFERKRITEGDPEADFHKPIVLIGFHRTGESIALSLRKEDLLVIEFDPEIARKLESLGFDYIFGDIADTDIFEKANIDEAKLLISTSPDLSDNLALLEEVTSVPERPKVIVRAETEADAHLLYDKGADYVLLPHYTSGQYLGKTIAIDPEMRVLGQLRERDLSLLKRLNHTG